MTGRYRRREPGGGAVRVRVGVDVRGTSLVALGVRVREAIGVAVRLGVDVVAGARYVTSRKGG